MSSVAQELYRERCEAARSEVELLIAREGTIANLRMVVFIAAIVIAWLVFDRDLLPLVALVVPLAIFAALVVYHAKVIRERRRGERIVAHYAHGLARIDGTWLEYGVRGEKFSSADHPYAADLDIFGHGSLFQLLCIARTALGQSTLAAWLSAPAKPRVVGQRCPAVGELRTDVDRRQELALIGEEVACDIDADHLVSWAVGPVAESITPLRWVAAGLVVGSFLTFALQRAGIAPTSVFLVAIAAQTTFGLAQRKVVERVTKALEVPASELAALARILEQIEQSTFRSTPLIDLRERLGDGESAASAAITDLHKRIQLLDARRNQMFAGLAPLLLWATQCCLAIEAWRRDHGPQVAAWLAVAGEYEALNCLAAFAYEHSENTVWPTVEEQRPEEQASAEQPWAERSETFRVVSRFVARDLRHPLMPQETCVGNDVSIGHAPALIVVSGSNMSGKSTLLRSIGTNAVLAQAGAPVFAAELRMTPLQVGTSMRMQDSLLDGTSKFYAEIKRLKRIVDLVGGEPPLLFLLDEVLHGTNSHDRGVGAAAVVETLLSKGAIGLITTHDLKLAEVADSLEERARNVHFADQLVDGAMSFDYKMRDGPVQKSNALGLMRAIGLEV